MSKRLKRVDTFWRPNLAYVIGIIASDGNLSPSGRHINITSKDKDLVLNTKEILGLKNKIGRKSRGGSVEKKYYVLQFGDINFYEFLLKIGLTPAKSKTLGKIEIPEKYFADFLRGCIDGDGSIGFHMHPQSKQKQWKVRLCSASLPFLGWIKTMMKKHISLKGGTLYIQPNRSTYVLSFGKEDSGKILNFMYYDTHIPALERKRVLALECLNGRVA